MEQNLREVRQREKLEKREVKEREKERVYLEFREWFTKKMGTKGEEFN